MSSFVQTSAPPFVDRRNHDNVGSAPDYERRQFANSHDGLSPEARELATAVDQYKLVHRRRFVTFEEILSVIKELGYEKSVT
jgi:hypothetical protein